MPRVFYNHISLQSLWAPMSSISQLADLYPEDIVTINASKSRPAPRAFTTQQGLTMRCDEICSATLDVYKPGRVNGSKMTLHRQGVGRISGLNRREPYRINRQSRARKSVEVARYKTASGDSISDHEGEG